MIESLKELVRTTNVQDALPKMGVYAANRKEQKASVTEIS